MKVIEEQSVILRAWQDAVLRSAVFFLEIGSFPLSFSHSVPIYPGKAAISSHCGE